MSQPPHDFFPAHPDLLSLDGLTCNEVEALWNRPQTYQQRQGTINLDGHEKNHEVAATLAQAWNDGYDSIKLKNYTTPAGLKQQEVIVVRNPNQLRSVNAAFDPARISEPGLLLSDTGKPSAIGAALAGAEGKPIRAYRGVDNPNYLEPSRRGGRSSGAYWASSSPEVANTYAGLEPNGSHWINDPPPPGSYVSDLDHLDLGGQTVAPIDAHFNNPYTIDAHGRGWGDIPIGDKTTNTDALARLARMRGHDGLVVHNVIDAAGDELRPATTIAALKRGTVKSPLTGETLFSDTGKPSLMGNALAGDHGQDQNASLMDILKQYGVHF